MMESADDIIAALRGLTAGYVKRLSWRETNFQIHSGEIFAVLGQSGREKSTLLKGIEPTSRSGISTSFTTTN